MTALDTAPLGAITVQGLRKAYGELDVLRDVTFGVAKGSIFDAAAGRRGPRPARPEAEHERDADHDHDRENLVLVARLVVIPVPCSLEYQPLAAKTSRHGSSPARTGSPAGASAAGR